MHMTITHVGALRHRWLQRLRSRQARDSSNFWESLATERWHEGVVWLVLASVCLALIVICSAWPILRG